MKALTRRSLDSINSSNAVLARAFIDRSRKTQSAVEDEKRALIKEFNHSTTPAYLYDYYMGICQRPTWDLTDDSKVAKQTGLTVRTVRDTRLRLQKAGWIRFDTFTHGGIKYGLWYIGKTIVSYQFGKDSTLADFEELGITLPEDGLPVVEQ